MNFTHRDEWINPKVNIKIFDCKKNTYIILKWKVPVACFTLIPIAVYTILLFIVAFISNPTLIWILLRNKELMSPVNVLILALSALNIVGTLIELPLVTVSSMLCE